VLLSLALPKLPSVAAKSLSLSDIKALLAAPLEQTTELFSWSDSSDRFIRNIAFSFSNYAGAVKHVSSASERSENFLNCQKSALLSQMLLRHKLIAFLGLKPSQEETGPLFRDLIVQYCLLFITTQTLVFDLAPYLHYLPECLQGRAPGATAVNADLVHMFDVEAAASGDNLVRKARILLNKAKL